MKKISTPPWISRLDILISIVIFFLLVIESFIKIYHKTNPLEPALGTSLLILFILITLRIHAYYHEFFHYICCKIFGYRAKVLIYRTKVKSVKVTVPRGWLNPFHFLIIIIAPFIIDILISYTLYILIPEQIGLVLLFFIVFGISGAKSDLCLFFLSLPLIFKKQTRLKYYKQGVFEVQRLN